MSLIWPSDSPVELREGIDGIGGGRGVFASQALHAGQLILKESPLIAVPIDKGHDETLHSSLARAIVESERREELLGLIATFHPRGLNDIASEDITKARRNYRSDIERLSPLMTKGQAREPTSKNEASNEEGGDDAALLLLLKIQCNSFYSGVYLLSAMFNHRCCPNAVKLARGGGSEVRALREIEAGEEVTFSYVAPPLQSFKRRHDLLLLQHYFSISQFTCGHPSILEGQAEGAVEEERVRFLVSFENKLDEIDSALSSAVDYEALSKHLVDLSALSMEANCFLHPRHISLARLNGILVTASRSLLPLSQQDLTNHVISLSSTSIALTLIRAALELKETQEVYSGSSEHYDLALTLEDLYVTIEHLLSNDPKALFSELKQFSSFSKASLAVSQLKKKHKHIVSLYSRD